MISEKINVDEENVIENTISYEIIYKEYATKMLALIHRYVRSKDEANDILHDGFIKVFMNLKKFRFESALETWITRIMINTSISYLRKDIARQYKTNVIEEDYLDEDENENEFFYSYDIKPEKLLDLLHELPVGYRTVLNLYIFENYSHRDIAKELNISESTSRTQFFKARIMLKKLLKRYLIADAI